MLEDKEVKRAEELHVDTLSQWPTLTAAMGCLDCKKIFRHMRDDGRSPRCPFCGSESAINVAEILNPGPNSPRRVDPAPILETIEGLISRLEGMIDSRSIIE